MKKLILLSCALLLPISVLTAQDNISKMYEISDPGNDIIMGGQVTVTKGSPYFTDWQKGYMILDNGSKTKDMLLRYDVYKEEIQFHRDKDIYVIPVKKINSYVIYTTDNNIIFRNGFSTDKDEITKSTLLRIIYDGKVKLIAHHSTELIEDVITYSNANDLQEYVHDLDYFLITADGKFHKVDLDIDAIIKVLPDQNKDLKEYAIEHNLNEYRREFRIYKLLEFYEK